MRVELRADRTSVRDEWRLFSPPGPALHFLRNAFRSVSRGSISSNSWQIRRDGRTSESTVSDSEGSFSTRFPAFFQAFIPRSKLPNRCMVTTSPVWEGRNGDGTK
jgi:hypothetical protein